jgi:hypothetical protein
MVVWMFILLFVGIIIVPLIAVFGFFYVITGRKILEERSHTPIFSVRCTVRSPRIGVATIGTHASSASSPARITVYKDFLVIKTIEGLIFNKAKTHFKIQKSHSNTRLFIDEGEFGDDIEIRSKQRKIIAALKSAGYSVRDEA